MTDVGNKCREQYHTVYYNIIKMNFFATVYYLAFYAGT